MYESIPQWVTEKMMCKRNVEKSEFHIKLISRDTVSFTCQNTDRVGTRSQHDNTQTNNVRVKQAYVAKGMKLD